MDEKELLGRIERAVRENVTFLNLSHKGLTCLPPEIGRLTNLRTLYLEYNQLTNVPAEFAQLANLTELRLDSNQLTSTPPELAQLTNLIALDLNNNRLTSVAPELAQLRNLRHLRLDNNRVLTLPPELGQLTNLVALHLNNNQLTSIPPELGQLANLISLRLDNNRLTSVPSEIGKLSRLQVLLLYYNRLTSIPKELGQLTNLARFYLHNNQLTAVPAELSKLDNLEEFHLHYNQIGSVPPEFGQLRKLTALHLRSNQLTNVPAELAQLTNLMYLRLDNNQLASVPPELGKLKGLKELRLEGNKGLMSPPPQVIDQGTEAVLVYLREKLKEYKGQWVSKLLLVGEGGVGKTSLLKSLREEEFVEGLETTHGIGVDKLELEHPSEKHVAMELNTWDFGGQQIYHATHQFFLTNRSLFVLVWDARHGWEAGKLYNWLDRIQARAPDSPVMIVAAHSDERDADLPLDDLQRKYPQIKGHYKISNKDGTGIEDFRKRLAGVAADLPLMGEEWPASWLGAANEIRARDEDHISPSEMFGVMERHELGREASTVLAGWLHELGDILYFKEDDELNDTVILNPVWVTEAISDVLESKEVVEEDGILTRENRDHLWTDVDRSVREHFLRLMERFDLSYRTLEDREISLVVECLPLDPPEYREKWEAIRGIQGCKEISMKFSLNTLPAGIPTWFIARSHRFTTHTHWRMGALFADNSERRHLGLIQADGHERQLQLTVRGPAPHNFFALLRDGLELTLARFPGLRIKRTVPCPGHDGGGCLHEFDFAKLQKAIERDAPVMEVQCQDAFENVSVPRLLFGLHWSTEGNVISRIDELEEKVMGGQEAILTELRELRELAQREFLRLFNAQQQLAESHCPNVFAVLPKEGRWSDKLLGQKMVMQLFCQAPGHWHQVVKGAKGGRYEIRKPADFFKSMGPYILKLAELIKYAAPVAGAAAGVAAAGQIKLMEELAKKLADRSYQEAELLERTGVGGKAERIEGMELRALRVLLDKEDPQHGWGGLKKVLTPEGHYLWLCEEHAGEYRI